MHSMRSKNEMKKLIIKFEKTSIYLIILTIIIVVTAQVEAQDDNSNGITTISTNSIEVFHDEGELSRIALGLSFSRSMNRSSVEEVMSVKTNNGTWRLSDNYKPFTTIWNATSTELNIEFPPHLIVTFEINYIEIQADGPMKNTEGDSVWMQGGSGTTIGSIDENETTYSTFPLISLIMMFIPLIVLFFIYIIINQIIKNQVRKEVKSKARSSEGTVEVLLRLLDDTERWIKKRLAYTLGLSFATIVIYYIIFIYIISSMNDLGGNIILFFIVFVVPWFIVGIFSYLYYRIKKENEIWKARIRTMKTYENKLMENSSEVV